MLIGVSLSAYVFNLKVRDLPVHQTWGNLVFVSVMYFSYLYLFSKFFYNAYIAKRHPKTVDKKAQ